MKDISEVVFSKQLILLTTIACAICSTVFYTKISFAASFQVRGGSIFSEGNITVSSPGSNVDYGIIANGTISDDNISSGAGNSTSMIISNDASPLGNANISHHANIKQQIKDHFITAAHKITLYKNNIDISADSGYQIFCPSSASLDECDGEDPTSRYRITATSGLLLKRNMTITASEPLRSGFTHLIYAYNNVDITIGSNLTYADDSPYINAFYIPQYIIYTTGNIYINTSVTEINAILIADGTISTCPEGSSTCSGQLHINGAIFTNDLQLGRTGGEIITHSAYTTFWANSKSEDYSRATTTYIRELAPRF